MDVPLVIKLVGTTVEIKGEADHTLNLWTVCARS